VDDDPQVLDSTSSLIRMWGYEAVPCRSAKEAMEEYLKGGIGLVLSDINMLEISGIELLGMITDINPNIPVILMTAYGELEIAIDAVRKGAFDFITNPFKLEYLQHAVEKGIRSRQLIELEENYIAVLEGKVRESEENLEGGSGDSAKFVAGLRAKSDRI
jgi:putative two-component system response regulator